MCLEFRRVLFRSRARPQNARARTNLGNAYLRQGDPARALPQFAAAVQLMPYRAEAQNNLGVALASLGETDHGLAHYRTAARLNPHLLDARFNLGLALVEQGAFAEAIPHLEGEGSQFGGRQVTDGSGNQLAPVQVVGGVDDEHAARRGERGERGEADEQRQAVQSATLFQRELMFVHGAILFLRWGWVARCYDAAAPAVGLLFCSRLAASMRR